MGRRKSCAIPRALINATTQSRGVVQPGAPGNLANRNGVISFTFKITAAKMLMPEISVITVTNETIFCRGRRWFSTSNVVIAEELSRNKLATATCWLARSTQAKAKQVAKIAAGKKRSAPEDATPISVGVVLVMASVRPGDDFTRAN